MKRAVLCLALVLAVGAQASPLVSTDALPSAQFELRLDGLRSSRGMVRACLTRNPTFFPGCDHDPASVKASVAAGRGARLEFELPPGDYAVMVLHDENSNSKVDTVMGIPREGVGFSRNPSLMFGPPRFDAVRLHIPAGSSEAEVKLKYFL